MGFDLGNASVEVVADVKRDVIALERALKGGSFDSRTGIGIDFNRCDTTDLKKELAEKKEWLKKYTPQKLTKSQANKAYARAKELKERIKAKLLPNKMFHQFYPDSRKKEKDFDDAVGHEVKLLRDKDYKRDVAEFRHLMRQIDHDDPRVTNLEELREGRHVRIRR